MNRLKLISGVQCRRVTFIFLLSFLYTVSLYSRTLYSYQSGNWNVADSWTTDPSGTTLVGNYIPGNSDSIFVLSDRTISLSGYVVATNLFLEIRSGGILDIQTFSLKSVSVLNGQGTIRSRNDSIPVAATNGFINTGGGTVEYYNMNNSKICANQLTYNNLVISNSTGNANSVFIDNSASQSYTINGNFELKNTSTGSLTFYFGNSAASDNLLNMTVYGDFTVNSGCKVKVNNFASNNHKMQGSVAMLTYPVHTLNLYGNLNNNGSVRFTGLPTTFNNGYYLLNDNQYNSVNYGAVQVYFKGESDNTVTCNDTTDFFRLVVEKGSDNTYVLNVHSSSTKNFRLFGPNDQGGGSKTDGPEGIGWGHYYKALFIHYGTLKLDANINIPSLTEGGMDFIVLPTAAFWVNGATVSTTLSGTNGNAYQGAILCGRLKMSDGTFSTADATGLVLSPLGVPEIILEGTGVLDVSQLWVDPSATNKISYIQNGGTANMRLQGQGQTNSVMLDLSNPNTVFIMTGGTINFTDNEFSDGGNCYNILDIESKEGNYQVTGGTLNFNLPGSGTIYDANSTVPFYNVNILRNSASLNTIVRWNSSGKSTGINENLTVLNDLNIGPNTILNLSTNTIDLNVEHDFNISANGTYTCGSNHTILSGTGTQLFANKGTITSGLNKFFIDKNSGTAKLGSNFSVRDSFAIFSGILFDSTFTLSVAGNIYNAGTHYGNGKIILNGSVIQTLTASVSGSPLLGNLDIQNTVNPVGAQLASDFTIQSLILTGTRSVFNIGSYELTISNGSLTSSGAGFGTAKMIQTSGLSSDGGLKMRVNAASLTSGQSKIFPIGVSGKYTPAFINGNTSPGSGIGFVTFIPVNSTHPAENTTKKHLHFYWKSKISGMPTGANVYYSFIDNVAGDWENGVNSAYVLISGATDWESGGVANNPNVNINGITNSNGYIAADITCGNNSAFNKVTAYYTTASGPWNSNIWSNTDHTTATNCGCQPNKASDIIYIGGVPGRNDSVTFPAVAYSVASITIEGTKTNNDRRPTLNLQGNGNRLTADIMKGAGKLASSSATLYTGTCDLGGLLTNDSALIQFYGGSYTLPTLTKSYPNLLITGGNTKYLPGSTVVRSDLRIADAANTNNALSLNGTSGDLTVYGDVKFLNGGKLVVPATNTARNINIFGDINFKYCNTNAANSIEATYSNVTGVVHKLNFYGDTLVSGASNLTFNPTPASNRNKIDFYLKDPGHTVITNGTGAFSLNRLFIQKDVLTDTVYFKNNFTLTETNNNTENKSLNLTTGTLVLSDNSNGSASLMDLNLSSGGDNFFRLPSTSALILRNGSKVNITGNSAGSGIFLDGLLQAEGTSQINLADVNAANTGYIQYSVSGNSEINLLGSSVLKASQICRPASSNTGILKYTQAGSSSVTIYGLGVIATRAKFEILGAGSTFNYSSTNSLSIFRGGGTTFGDLYIRPETSNITGGSIIFGTGQTGLSYKMDANVPLNNLILEGTNNTLELMVSPLQLKGNLTIGSTGTFDAVNQTNNSIDVSLRGNYTNNGTYTYGSNITTFNGLANQSISGTTALQFYDLVISPTTPNTVTANANITVNGNLFINSGTFSSSTFNINLKGNVTNNSIHNGDSATGGIILNGPALQHIAGTGIYGRIELNNPKGARIDNNIILQKNIKLSNGILDINQYLLTLGPKSIIEGSGFSSTKMIMTNGVYSDVGLIKNFEAKPFNFTFPVGVTGKYTRVTINTTENSSAGLIRVNPINYYHPTAIYPDSVLQYFWEIASSGLNNVTATLNCYYAQADVRGREDQYVAGALMLSGTKWSKASPEGDTIDRVDQNNNKITFTYESVNSVSGDYTAGQDNSIPDNVQTYTSKGSGNWNDITKWDPTPPAGGPNGFIVVIRSGDSIYTNGNRRFAYRTAINGILYVGTTYGHNLGNVTGIGKLHLRTATMPAGRYTSFFNCSGGTVEYGGNTNYTIIATNMDTIRRLYFSGTGIITLPNKTLVICDSLRINGPTVDNSVNNKKLVILGSIVRTSGMFKSGSGSEATVEMNGSFPQTIGNFTGTSALNNFQIDNLAGVILAGPVQIKENLLLTNGVINTATTIADSLSIINTSMSCVFPNGGSISSYVSGPLIKNIIAGDNFTFPIGKGSRFGKLTLSNTLKGTSRWTTEYFNVGSAYKTINSPLSVVSGSEYWKVTGLTSNEAKVKLRWDSNSDINPDVTQNGISDIRVAQLNGSNQWIELPTTTSGSSSEGYAETNSRIALGGTYYFTLAAINAVKLIARFVSTTPICAGGNLSVVFTGPSPWKFTYKINGVVQTADTIRPSTNPATYTAAASGWYNLDKYFSQNLLKNVDTLGVRVNGIVTQPDTLGAARCGSGYVTLRAFEALSTESYKWYNALTAGTLLQTGGETFATPIIGVTTNYYVTKYNTTTMCESSPRLPVVAIIASQPASIGITKVPNLASACAGNALSVADPVGTGGTGTINYEYRFSSTGGTSWSDWTSATTYTALKGNNQIAFRRTATGSGCVPSTPYIVSWLVTPNPASGPLYRLPNR